MATVDIQRFAFDLQPGSVVPGNGGLLSAPGILPATVRPNAPGGVMSSLVTNSSCPTGPASAVGSRGVVLDVATGFFYNGRSTGRLNLSVAGDININASALLNLRWGETGNIIEQPTISYNII
jgi:hypothetical protein